MKSKIEDILSRVYPVNEAIKPEVDDYDFNGLEEKISTEIPPSPDTLSLTIFSKSVFFKKDGKIYLVGKYTNKGLLHNHWALCEVYNDIMLKDNKRHFAAKLRCVMFLKEDPNAKKLGYNNPFTVTAVYTMEKYRKQGFGLLLYRIMMSHFNYTLVGDHFQYLGARKSWVKLSSIGGVKVDIIDIRAHATRKLEESVKLTSTDDPRVWVEERFYKDNEHIRTGKMSTKEDSKKLYIAKFIRTIATSSTLPDDVEIIEPIENYK